MIMKRVMLPIMCDVPGFYFSANFDSRFHWNTACHNTVRADTTVYSSANVVGTSNLNLVNGGFSNILNTNGQIS